MPIEQRYRRKTGETREETTTTGRKKKENCKLGVFGRTSDFYTLFSTDLILII